MANIKGFKKYIVDNIALIEVGNITPKLIEDKFKTMTDKDIEALYLRLKNEQGYLPFYITNAETQKLDVRKWIKLAKDLGVDVFTKVVQSDETTGQTYVSEIEYWVGLFQVRRHLHYLDVKRTIAKDNKTRDTLTGQVTGSSKGSSFSKPQLMGVLSRGCTANALELYKYRGGDISGGREFNKQLISTGGVSIKSLISTKTVPTSSKTLSSYLSGMHLQHNLTN